MNKIRNKKHRKHLTTLVCLLVGMLVLTSAVYANSDDAKGYSNLKNAVKQIAFYEDNFTLEGEVKFAMDNVNFSSVKVSSIKDGDDDASIITLNTKNGVPDSGDRNEHYGVAGKEYFYYPKENEYYMNDSSSNTGLDINDPTVKKVVRFVELVGDTLVGDLKNNVVYVGGEDGSKNYTVNISGTQVPEVVNAGISLFMGLEEESTKVDRYSVDYEDYWLLLGANYKKETGKIMDQEAYSNGTLDISKLENNMRKQYEDVLASKGSQGVVFVKADGSYDYYATYDEYAAEKITLETDPTDIIIKKMGENPYIDSVHCDFSIDKDGNPSAIDMKAIMAGKDPAGKKHVISMEIKGTVKDFGSSKVVLPDFSNATKMSK